MVLPLFVPHTRMPYMPHLDCQRPPYPPHTHTHTLRAAASCASAPLSTPSLPTRTHLPCVLPPRLLSSAPRPPPLSSGHPPFPSSCVPWGQGAQEGGGGGGATGQGAQEGGGGVTDRRHGHGQCVQGGHCGAPGQDRKDHGGRLLGARCKRFSVHWRCLMGIYVCMCKFMRGRVYATARACVCVCVCLMSWARPQHARICTHRLEPTARTYARAQIRPQHARICTSGCA